MERKIFKLSEPLINQIAAGEVVENAASIVKELVENSIDAGASRIKVSLIQGGRQLIQVEDDGCGMHKEDALACLERHATSKIHTIEDLDALSTKGFRGEALAAIAGISHLQITTSDGNEATSISCEGGQVKEVSVCARNQGTTMDVKFLFFNVPARKKFQKSPTYSATQARKVFETISLAHPEISFQLFINNKLSLDLPKTTQKARIEALLGSYEHELALNDLTGYVAAPNRAGATRQGQYLFINRRPIFSPLIARAVKEAYSTRISPHDYPPFVLFLNVAPDRVDVNVHPQKKEVRFENESAIFLQVKKGVESVFASLEPIFTAPPPFESASFSAPSQDFNFSTTLPMPAFKVQEPLDLPMEFHAKALAIYGSYLLLEQERLILVDLKALHARLLFEQIKFLKTPSQALIWPLEIPIEDDALEEPLNALGIECRMLKKTLVVDALPPYLDAAYFSTFLEEWQRRGKIESIVTGYCKTSKKTYQLQEAMQMFQELKKCSDVRYDPSGSPIWMELKSEHFAELLSNRSM